MRPVHFTQDQGIRWRSGVLPAIAAVLAVAISGCGYGSSSNTSNTPTSGIKKRVLVSNETGSGSATPVGGVPVAPGLQILDATKDAVTAFNIGVAGASKMVTNGGFTVVIDDNENAVTIVDNTKEQPVQTFQTLDRVMDLAVTPNGGTAFAAVRNPGILNVINTKTDAGTVLNIPTVSRVVVSPNGTKALAFVDDPQSLVSFPQNSFFVIDTASNSVTPISRTGGCNSAAMPVTCDQPFSAVFNGSETKAFILNCGAECGGTAGTASVVTVDFSGATPVFGTPIPVSAATVGLLNGTNLFVAGTPPGSASGTLQIINTGTSTAGPPISIANGIHTKMVMASNNRLYIGASTCTPVNDASTGLTRGCLSIFNTSSSALVFPEFNSLRTSFDVTGIQPISNRNVVYVVEGAALDIFDTTTDKLTPTQPVIVGRALDVVQIDP